MRHFTLAALLCLLTLTACGSAKDKDVDFKQHLNDKDYLLRHAKAGNVQAQWLLGSYYCSNEPAEAKGEETLRWWKRAAASINTDTVYATAAMEDLGKFYLALYEIELWYDPAKSEPDAPCTGRAAGDTDAAEAQKWFHKCVVSSEGLGESCQMGLGHLFYRQKDFEKAYFWFATVLASNLYYLASKKPNKHSKTDIMPIDPAFYGETDAHNARLAAKHLKPGQIKSLNKRAMKWHENMEKAWMDRVFSDDDFDIDLYKIMELQKTEGLNQ